MDVGANRSSINLNQHQNYISLTHFSYFLFKDGILVCPYKVRHREGRASQELQRLLY